MDLFITNIPEVVSKIINCVGIGDHLAVIIQLEDVSRRPKVKRSVKLFHKANFDLINYQLYQNYLELLDGATARTVNENWDQFKKHIRNVEKLVPIRTVNVNADPPWYNRKLNVLMPDRENFIKRLGKMDVICCSNGIRKCEQSSNVPIERQR